MLSIDPLIASDLASAVRLSARAGWNQIEADWVRLIDLWPEYCLAGRVEGQLVATATLAVFPPRLAWVGMVLVDADHQQRGYGTGMLDEIVRRSEAAGVEIAGLDATDLGRPIYLKRGFVDHRRVDRWRRSAVEADEPDTSNQKVDWEHLLDFDREQIGFDRSRLLRYLGGEATVVAQVIENNQMAAYGFRRRGRTADHIGPIVARNVAAADICLGRLLQSQSGQAVMIDVPRGNSFSQHLPTHGFAIARELHRMVKPIRPDKIFQDTAHFAIAGFELG